MPGAYFQHSRWRTGKPDAVKTFINVRSAGHYITHHDFRDVGGKKDFLEIFWCACGEGYFLNNGKEIKMSCGDFFCYLPGSIHRIYSNNSNWEYYWLTCDGPDIDALIRTFDLKQSLRHIGTPPAELFNTVIDSLKSIDAAGAIRASVAAYEILLRALNPLFETSASKDIVKQFEAIVEQNYFRPDFSLQKAAEIMKIHRSTLHRTFISKNGISPQDYLTSFRLQQALEMLTTEANIKEIAAACGFNAPHYFAKVFRKCFGKSPGDFRKNMVVAGNVDVTS